MDPLRCRLRKAIESTDSLVCVGLDPQPEETPASEILRFNQGVIRETAPFAAAFKPQSAFYEAAGDSAWTALRETIAFIRNEAPDALVILDVKRGDVPNTAEACASMAFDHFGADMATVNPYLGSDGAEPFLRRPEHGAFFLCRTSNEGSGEIQLLEVQGRDGTVQPLYEAVAQRVEQWGTKNQNAGVVMGATHQSELAAVRQRCPDLPFLVPGVGAQGGALEESVRNGLDRHGSGLLINSSRSLIYPKEGSPRKAAEKLRENINRARESARASAAL